MRRAFVLLPGLSFALACAPPGLSSAAWLLRDPEIECEERFETAEGFVPSCGCDLRLGLEIGVGEGTAVIQNRSAGPIPGEAAGFAFVSQAMEYSESDSCASDWPASAFRILYLATP